MSSVPTATLPAATTPELRTRENAVAVVVPVRDERVDLGALVDAIAAALRGRAFEVALVDDGSKERIELVPQPFLKLLRHTAGRGYGAALKTGIRATQAPWIAILDADGTYAPADLARLLARLDEGADMAIGERQGSDGSSALRRAPKAVLRRFASAVTGEPIPDLNSGLRVFRRELALECWELLPQGFSFTSTITVSALARGRRVEWVPVELARRIGRSKIRPLRDTLAFTALLVRLALWFDPLRVFLPLAACFGLLALGCGVYDVLQGNLADKTVLLFVAFVQLLAVGALADLVLRRGRERAP
jgi:glycosyltransferase involved in cell wall biosynthesis